VPGSQVLNQCWPKFILDQDGVRDADGGGEPAHGPRGVERQIIDVVSKGGMGTFHTGGGEKGQQNRAFRMSVTPAFEEGRALLVFAQRSAVKVQPVSGAPRQPGVCICLLEPVFPTDSAAPSPP